MYQNLSLCGDVYDFGTWRFHPQSIETNTVWAVAKLNSFYFLETI